MNGLPAVTANFTNRALIIGALLTFSGSIYSVVVGIGVVVVVVVVDGVVVIVTICVDCDVTNVVAAPPTALIPPKLRSGVVVSNTPIVRGVVNYAMQINK